MNLIARVTVVLVLILVSSSCKRWLAPAPNIPTKAYFTTDDSSPEASMKALFVDDIEKVPPFEKDGKHAYRANVFSCDGGKTKWIGWIERYSDESKKIIDAQMAAANPDNLKLDDARMTGLEVKRPGDKEWITYKQQNEYQKAMEVTCPDGKVENIEMMLP